MTRAEIYADRHRRIAELLEKGLTTGEALAAAVHVDRRTIYRDVQRMRDTGVGIIGERGVGYMLGRTKIAYAGAGDVS